MIDLVRKKIIIRDKEYDITKTEVWWNIDGLGLIQNLDQLKQYVTENIRINPVPVAISETEDGFIYEPI